MYLLQPLLIIIRMYYLINMEYSVKIITYGSKLITILYSNEATRATRVRLETELRLSLLHFTYRIAKVLMSRL